MNYCITIFGCKSYEDIAKVFVEEFSVNNKGLLESCIFFSDGWINDLGIRQIAINDKYSWAMRIAKSLEKVESDYVLFLLDDYFIQSRLCTNQLEMICCHAQSYDVKYCRLINIPRDKEFGNMKPIKVGSYGINLQPALWHREFLISLLTKIDSNPWVTETSLHNYFTINSNEYLYTCGYGLIDNYLNAVIKGKWSRKVPKNLMMNSSRIRMNRLEWLLYRGKSIFSELLDPKSKIVLKKALKKIGFKFYS